jgi:alanyl-tRNA synthetase
MKVNEIRQKYIDFFKTLDHTEISSASLIPENDPTTLFTGSGMQPLIPYLLGEEHPNGKRLVNSQKCFRAEDIDEVGDNRHTTFFEMLGNWSLGDYFKEEQIPWLLKFLTEGIGLDPNKLYITVFSGDKQSGIEKDIETIDIWSQLFEANKITNNVVDLSQDQQASEKEIQDGRIFVYNASKNWWSRAGVPSNMPPGELGGPDSEVFYDFGTKHDKQFGDKCHPNCDCGRFMEIGNSVFMEYIKNDSGGFDSLPKKNVDFGGGLERLAAASIDKADVFMIDVFQQSINVLEQITNKRYSDQSTQESFRIVADHMRGVVFMISDGIIPTNTDKGYFVRRLLRRAIRHLDVLGANEGTASKLVKVIIKEYQDNYTNLPKQQNEIETTVTNEEIKFRTTLKAGLKEFSKKIKDSVTGQDAWYLFTTYGFPIELTKDLAKESDILIDPNLDEDFAKAKKTHQDASKKGADKKFKGGLADQSEMSIKYHTTTHLLHAALRKILGEHVTQTGSNITAERLRFDFKHEAKLTAEEITTVENEVNSTIQKKHDVVKKEMTIQEAKELGAIGLFEEKYGNKVSVYSIADVSNEICGGPHIQNTSELGTFRIIKEESSGAGVRRIKALLESN